MSLSHHKKVTFNSRICWLNLMITTSLYSCILLILSYCGILEHICDGRSKSESVLLDSIIMVVNICDNIEGWQMIKQEDTANLFLDYFRVHSTQLAKEMRLFTVNLCTEFLYRWSLAQEFNVTKKVLWQCTMRGVYLFDSLGVGMCVYVDPLKHYCTVWIGNTLVLYRTVQ